MTLYLVPGPYFTSLEDPATLSQALITKASNFLTGFNFVGQDQETGNILAQQQPEPRKLRVGIQIGHLDQENVPEELAGLNDNYNNSFLHPLRTEEVSISATVAKEVARLLQAEGIEIDLLPATVPSEYLADAFVSLHADWSKDKNIRGFKIAGSDFDKSGASEKLADSIKNFYQDIIGLPWHNFITPGMKQYYAFNYESFEHSISPQTPAAIIELGFLTNKQDYEFLQNNPQKVAKAITQGILDFLKHINSN